MSQRAETLDELIDRIAAELTQAPHTTGLGEQVAARLDRPRAIGPWIPAASLAAVALVILGVLLSRPPAPMPLVVESVRTPAAVEVPSRNEPTAVAAQARAQVTTRTSAAQAPTEASRPRMSAPTAIPALPSPELLVFDQLSVDELAIPRVEIDQLDVSTLAIEGLTTDPDSKEQQP